MKIYFLFLLSLIACSNQKTDSTTQEKEVETDKNAILEIYTEIRKSKQQEFPEYRDKKLTAIRRLSFTYDESTVDSIKSIFNQIDTTIKGYWTYHHTILEALFAIQTPESCKLFAHILANQEIRIPSNRWFIWDLVRDTKQAKYFFPDLAKAIETQEWDAFYIFRFISKAYKSKHIKKNDLLSSKKYFMNYYENLKKYRQDLPVNQRTSDEALETKFRGKYKYELDILIQVLRIYKGDEDLFPLYQEILKNNTDFIDFNSFKGRNYEETLLREAKIDILIEAILALAENEQKIDVKYIEKVAIEPIGRLELYKELTLLNRIDLFPKKYYNQFYFAESDLYKRRKGRKEEDFPPDLQFIKKAIKKDGEQKGTYYFYKQPKINSKNENVFDIIVSGPQPLEENSFVVLGSATNIVVKKGVSEMNIEKIIDKYINYLE